MQGRRIESFALGLLLVFLSAVALGAAPDFIEGEALVTFKKSATVADARQAITRHGAETRRHFRWLSQQHGRPRFHVRSQTKTTAALIAELKQNPDVESAEPNYLRHHCDMAAPDDSSFAQLWALRNNGQTVDNVTGTAGADIRFLAAWEQADTNSAPPVVAIIDTGVDYSHPDLAANIWTNPGEIPGNGIDDDGNGYVDDVHGYDFAVPDSDPMDAADHGTHVAGTVAAAGNNRLGVIGVNFRARIMALKVSTDGSNLDTASVIEAIEYAAMMKALHGVNIVAINASYGDNNYSQAERAAILTAGDAGIVFCAAAGNSSANNDSTPFYPAGYRLTNMIVVAASDQNDALASFSNYGPATVDLAAPGVNILSSLPLALATATSFVQRASTVYTANPLTYSGITTGITGQIYHCGLGASTNFPPAVNGNIALIQRGTLYFSQKVSNAMAAGAKAAIIYNNVADNFSGTLQSASNWIPAVSISMADGQALLASLPGAGTVATVPATESLYRYLDGTSMAVPHVAGAVAFAAMNYPSETITQRIQRVLSHVTPIAGLSNTVRTGGRLNLVLWENRRWQADILRARPDGKRHILWRRLTRAVPDGQVSLWTLNNANAYQSALTLGPYIGWTAADMLVSANDSAPRLVWTNTAGAVSVWDFDAAGTYQSAHNYGPHTGWTLRDYIISAADNRRHLLWQHTSQIASLWTCSSSGDFLSASSYGPYSGWAPWNLRISPFDDRRHLTWTNTAATVSLWRFNAGAMETALTLGPVAGWSPAQLLPGAADGSARFAWTNATGAVSLWQINSGYAITDSAGFGPVTGWLPLGLLMRPANMMHLAWENNAGALCLWQVASTGAVLGGLSFGPFNGWRLQDAAVDAADKLHLLWLRTNGQISVWTLSATGALESAVPYGPY